MAKLVNRLSKQAYLLEGRAVVIGRHMSCSIRVLEKRVSRFHCALLASEGGWVLRDAASKLGTYVNGEFVAQPRRLQPGDRILVGRTEFVFEDRDDVEEGFRLERIRPASAEGLSIAAQGPQEPVVPPRRRVGRRALVTAIGLLVLGAAGVSLVLPLFRRDSAANIVWRAATLVGARRAAELWALLSPERRSEVSAEELHDRLSALPEVVTFALRTLEVGHSRATDGGGVAVPISIRLDGERLEGAVGLVREGRAWRIDTAPIHWLKRLAE